ncbi:hypothetical protein F5Y08DRAFT_133225 [Xylaria arbuscula]|nr:hypothetical protein F5Y08DRAFT_133225 [Xylaria arbuscula]
MAKMQGYLVSSIPAKIKLLPLVVMSTVGISRLPFAVAATLPFRASLPHEDELASAVSGLRNAVWFNTRHSYEQFEKVVTPTPVKLGASWNHRQNMALSSVFARVRDFAVTMVARSTVTDLKNGCLRSSPTQSRIFSAHIQTSSCTRFRLTLASPSFLIYRMISRGLKA